jgi:hypothetical protein
MAAFPWLCKNGVKVWVWWRLPLPEADPLSGLVKNGVKKAL